MQESMLDQTMTAIAEYPEEPLPNRSQDEASEAEQLCCYCNQTPKVQIIRITNLPDRDFERVVFPGQRLMFHAPDYARLEVYTGKPAGALLADTLTCDRIRVQN